MEDKSGERHTGYIVPSMYNIYSKPHEQYTVSRLRFSQMSSLDQVLTGLSHRLGRVDEFHP